MPRRHEQDLEDVRVVRHTHVGPRWPSGEERRNIRLQTPHLGPKYTRGHHGGTAAPLVNLPRLVVSHPHRLCPLLRNEQAVRDVRSLTPLTDP